jgi:hypothetical protein
MSSELLEASWLILIVVLALFTPCSPRRVLHGEVVFVWARRDLLLRAARLARLLLRHLQVVLELLARPLPRGLAIHHHLLALLRGEGDRLDEGSRLVAEGRPDLAVRVQDPEVDAPLLAVRGVDREVVVLKQAALEVLQERGQPLRGIVAGRGGGGRAEGGEGQPTRPVVADHEPTGSAARVAARPVAVSRRQGGGRLAAVVAHHDGTAGLQRRAPFGHDGGERPEGLVTGARGIPPELHDRLVGVLRDVEHALVDRLLPDVVEGDLQGVEVVEGRRVGGAGGEEELAHAARDRLASGRRRDAGQELVLGCGQRLHEARQVARDVLGADRIHGLDPRRGLGPGLRGRDRRVEQGSRAVRSHGAGQAEGQAVEGLDVRRLRRLPIALGERLHRVLGHRAVGRGLRLELVHVVGGQAQEATARGALRGVVGVHDVANTRLDDGLAFHERAFPRTHHAVGADGRGRQLGERLGQRGPECRLEGREPRAVEVHALLRDLDAAVADRADPLRVLGGTGEHAGSGLGLARHRRRQVQADFPEGVGAEPHEVLLGAARILAKRVRRVEQPGGRIDPRLLGRPDAQQKVRPLLLRVADLELGVLEEELELAVGLRQDTTDPVAVSFQVRKARRRRCRGDLLLGLRVGIDVENHHEQVRDAGSRFLQHDPTGDLVHVCLLLPFWIQYGKRPRKLAAGFRRCDLVHVLNL